MHYLTYGRDSNLSDLEADAILDLAGEERTVRPMSVEDNKAYFDSLSEAEQVDDLAGNGGEMPQYYNSLDVDIVEVQLSIKGIVQNLAAYRDNKAGITRMISSLIATKAASVKAVESAYKPFLEAFNALGVAEQARVLSNFRVNPDRLPDNVLGGPPVF